MLFKLRTSPIGTTVGLDVDRIMADITQAVKARADALTEEYRSHIVSSIYFSVRKRTGAIGRAVKPFVFMDSDSVTLGFDFDLTEAPHLMTQMMMTRGESSTKTISARASMLTIPLSDHIYGRSSKGMNLDVIPTGRNVFLGTKSGSGSDFKPQFVLEHSVKIPKRIKMYDIMDKFEETAIREIQKTVQDVVNRG
jgi:hypothetical protein